jgi:hypothetical protein
VVGFTIGSRGVIPGKEKTCDKRRRRRRRRNDNSIQFFILTC